MEDANERGGTLGKELAMAQGGHVGVVTATTAQDHFTEAVAAAKASVARARTPRPPGTR